MEDEDKHTSKCGRFKIEYERESGGFMDTHFWFHVRDTRTQKIIYTFEGDHLDEETLEATSFSPDQTEVIGTNEKGEIIERFKLP